MQESVDFFLTQKDNFLLKRKLVVFVWLIVIDIQDLDGTIIENECIDEIAYIAGVCSFLGNGIRWKTKWPI